MIYVWKNGLIFGILIDSLVYFAGKLIMNRNIPEYKKMQNYF